jgi:hypothetical protein
MFYYSQTLVDVIYLSVLILLPLVPAFILYQVLPPEKTYASGPFKGLNVQLSGSFCGYFLLYLGLIPLIVAWRKPPVRGFEIWTVSGRVGIADIPEFEKAPSKPSMSFRPSALTLNEDGTFSLGIPVPVETSGNRLFPTLIVEDVGHITANVHLGQTKPSYGLKIYTQSFPLGHPNTIEIDTPIILDKVAP